MAKMLDVEKSQFITKAIDIYQREKIGQYSKYLDKNPIFVTYYHIDMVQSRIDTGTGAIEVELGPRSPLRFNKITEFPLYNISDLKPDLEYDESGYNVNMDLSGIVILPNTIKPTPGDYFIIKLPGTKEYLFRVTSIRYNTIQSNDFYEIEADVRMVGDNIEEDSKIKVQIVDEFRTIFDMIGTDSHCFLRNTDIEYLASIKDVYEQLLRFYTEAFYHKDVNSFLFTSGRNESGDPVYIYDAFLEKFINDSKIFFVDNEERTLYLQPNDILQDRFDFVYAHSLYRALLDRNLTWLYANIYAILNPIKKRDSILKLYGFDANSVNLVQGPKTPLLTANEIDSNDVKRNDPIWFSIEILPCEGPTWTPNGFESNQYFPSRFIYPLIYGKMSEKFTYFERIIFNYLHRISERIDVSEIISQMDINDIWTFYFTPIICYILSEYHAEYIKKTSTSLIDT